jgi:hypothetical protein
MQHSQTTTPRLPIVAGRALRELGLVAAGLLVYFLVRGNVTERAALATRNAIAVIDAEKALGIFWEPAMQAWILESALQIRFWNWVYFWAHAPAIVVVGLWLLWRHGRTYELIRNAFLVSAVIGLVCYSLYPVAPPRLVPGYGFVDTMLLYSSTSYQAQSLSPFVNPYAAMPSLHFGWAFLLGVGIWLVWRDVRGVVLGVLLPLSMGLAIVLTANHYILDGVAGFAVCLVGLVVAVWWDRGRPLPRRRRRTAPRPRPVRAPGAV